CFRARGARIQRFTGRVALARGARRGDARRRSVRASRHARARHETVARPEALALVGQPRAAEIFATERQIEARAAAEAIAIEVRHAGEERRLVIAKDEHLGGPRLERRERAHHPLQVFVEARVDRRVDAAFVPGARYETLVAVSGNGLVAAPPERLF